MNRKAFAFEAMLDLDPDADSRAPGGVVTVALCGSWDHDGPCRWPHNSDLDTTSEPARLRTVVVAGPETENEVVTRIEQGLRADSRWSVASCARRDVAPEEQALAERLMNVTPSS